MPLEFCLDELVKYRNHHRLLEALVFCHTPKCMISSMSAVLTRPALRSVHAHTVAITPSLGMSFSVFAQLSESVAVAARHVGLIPPGFQSLATGVSRRLVRRTPAGPIIAVKVRGRSTGCWRSLPIHATRTSAWPRKCTRFSELKDGRFSKIAKLNQTTVLKVLRPHSL
jgi:hypothetical protein